MPVLPAFGRAQPLALLNRNSMQTIVRIGAALGFFGVALGAFGAHALKERLGAAGLATYHTGVEYHLVHGLAILLVAALSDRIVEEKRAILISRLFAVGIILFSGSLYALAITGTRWLGAITPLGGVCFLTGWALLAFSRPPAEKRRPDF